MVSRYQKRISGPLLDRIDIHVEVPRVEYEKLTDERLEEPSAAIRGRVERARERQRRRFEGMRLRCNADVGSAEVREVCQLDEAGKSLVRAAMQQLQMSARAFHRIPSLPSGQALKLARTMPTHRGRSDLSDADDIQTPHLAEAIQYRPRREV